MADRKVTVEFEALDKNIQRSFLDIDKASADVAGKIEGHFRNLNVDLSSAIKAPEMSGGGAGGDIAASLRQAIAPLDKALSGIGTKFSTIGDNIVAYLRRIDANIKFPTFDKTLTALRQLTNTTFGGMEGRAKQFGQVLENVLGGAQALNRARTFFMNYGRLAKGGFGEAAASTSAVTKATQLATSTVKGLGTQIALSLGAFGLAYKGIEAIKSGITGASDLNETISKTEAILGDAAPAVKAYADGLARNFGLVKRETLDAASSFGGLGKGLGKLTGNDLASFSKEFTTLAADLQSYANIGTLDEAAKALTIALSGEQSDTLKRLGVIVNDTTIKNYALANGFKVVSGAVSESDKFLIRRKLIMNGLSDAQGDLARTSSGTSNQIRKFTGTLTNLSTDIGTSLLPAVNVAVKGFAGAAASLGGAFERNKAVFAGVVNSLAAGFTRVGGLITYLLPSIQKIGGTLVGAFTGGGAAISGIVPDFQTLAVGAKTALEAINTGLATTIGWIKGIPQYIDDTFGAGTAVKIGEVALAIGGTAAALSVLGGTFSAVVAGAAALLAPLISIPVLAASAGLGLAYLTGSYTDLSDAANLVGFAITNTTDMFSYWYHSVKDFVLSIGEDFKNLGSSIAKFVTDPLNGFDFKIGEVKISKETEAAIERMRKNTFEPKKSIAPPMIPKFDPAAIQAQVLATMKAPVIPAKEFDAAKAKEDDKVSKRLDQFAKQFVDKTQTPLEKFQEAMRWATEAHDAKKLTDEQFARAGQFARDEAGLKDGTQFAGAIAANSQEAYSSALRQGSMSGRDYGTKDLTKPTKDTAKNTGEAVNILGRIADNLISAAKPVIFKFI